MGEEKDKAQVDYIAQDQVDDIEENTQWLEIDDDTIIGIHSHRCQSEMKWVRYDGEDLPQLGSKWINNKVVRQIDELSDDQLRIAALTHIKDVYPLWKQLNILREGDQIKIDKMGAFIDATRKWSNDPKAKLDKLKKIKP